MKKTQTQAFSNFIGGLIFLAIGIWAYVQTDTFQVIKNAYVQPATFPAVMTLGLIIFSAAVVVLNGLKLMKLDENDPLAEPAASINILKNKGIQGAAIMIVMCVLYVALFDTLGYVLCSALIGIVIMYLIGKRDPKIMLLVGILVPLIMWAIFYKVLQVNIPMGVLQPLKDLIDMI